MKDLYIDIETYCETDLKKTGVYPYMECPSFEILLIGYAVGDDPVTVVSFEDNQSEIDKFLRLVRSKQYRLIAHNATFERLAFETVFGIYRNWHCTMVQAAYCGLPMSLKNAAIAARLDVQKDSAGVNLIKYFSMPCKPTKTNKGRTRNMPEHDLEKWQAFKDYLVADVETTRALHKKLSKYEFTEQRNYQIDQKINDRGVLISRQMVENAVRINDETTHALSTEMRQITGLDNPNSLQQLGAWIEERTGERVDNLRAATVEAMLETASGDVGRVLRLRQMTSNTSIKKYSKALDYAGKDGRARGLFQFYGAGRTGRWAGRAIQLQNLPRNYMKLLDEARNMVMEGDSGTLGLMFESVPDVLKELTRTMIVPAEGNKFLVADFSAIEARVLAWLAGEEWILEVFRTHGKIYEATASNMFGVPLESVTKGSDYRQRGKVATLALGYQGGVGALTQMGAASMGLSEDEMDDIKTKWRKANPNIVRFWYSVQDAAIKAVKVRGRKIQCGYVSFLCDGETLACGLPSGRSLYYQNPVVTQGKYGDQLVYMGQNQTTGKWERTSTYGGKLAENITQAVARDLLMFSISNVEKAGFEIVMHVHDEIVVEESLPSLYDELITEMVKLPSWAKGLPLDADGFISNYYLKK